MLIIGITVLALNLRAAITSLPPVFPELSARLGGPWHLGGPWQPWRLDDLWRLGDL